MAILNQQKAICGKQDDTVESSALFNFHVKLKSFSSNESLFSTMLGVSHFQKCAQMNNSVATLVFVVFFLVTS